MIVPADFRKRFPEFVDPEVYSDGPIEFWGTLAGSILREDRWGELRELGACLYIAHHLALGQRDKKTAAIGGTPGEVRGPVTSKSVDKASSSHDTKAIALTDAGFWNATSYGMRFYQLARNVGAGGIQL